jgi:hypothetical protein
MSEMVPGSKRFLSTISPKNCQHLLLSVIGKQGEATFIILSKCLAYLSNALNPNIKNISSLIAWVNKALAAPLVVA